MGPQTKPDELWGACMANPTNSDTEIASQDGLNIKLPKHEPRRVVTSWACGFLDQGQSLPLKPSSLHAPEVTDPGMSESCPFADPSGHDR